MVNKYRLYTDSMGFVENRSHVSILQTHLIKSKSTDIDMSSCLKGLVILAVLSRGCCCEKQKVVDEPEDEDIDT